MKVEIDPHCAVFEEKIAWIKKTFGIDLPDAMQGVSAQSQYLVLVLLVLEQKLPFTKEILDALAQVETFYPGGLMGYHQQTLELLISKQGGVEHFEPPVGESLSEEDAAFGLRLLPQMAEIYPVGGAADRLGLFDPMTGEALPAAKLEIAGKELLTRLFEDLAGRESLYEKLYGGKIEVPVLLMTSPLSHNRARIENLLEENNWYGRSRRSIRLFDQPLVPLMDMEGQFKLDAYGKLMMRPGGHGVIWRCMEREGLFDWLVAKGVTHALVRQINNPVAGVDFGLLSFVAEGIKKKSAFGFCSCPRLMGAQEGMNVRVTREGKTALTNVEYCDFARHSITEKPLEPDSPYSEYPSNTNILFVHLERARTALKQLPIPGMVVNAKQIDGEKLVRLESTMQNLADAFDESETFIAFGERRKTISATKRQSKTGAPDLETPERCEIDMRENARELLASFALPEVFHFDYDPRLGPLYSIIRQKVRKGILAPNAVWQLDMECVDIENLDLDGALHLSGEGTLMLKNVKIRSPLVQIHVNRGGELVIKDLEIRSKLELEVPSGIRLTLHQRGRIESESIESPSWRWLYHLEGDRIKLTRIL